MSDARRQSRRLILPPRESETTIRSGCTLAANGWRQNCYRRNNRYNLAIWNNPQMCYDPTCYRAFDSRARCGQSRTRGVLETRRGAADPPVGGADQLARLRVDPDAVGITLSRRLAQRLPKTLEPL
jgi:hypothetical protein